MKSLALRIKKCRNLNDAVPTLRLLQLSTEDFNTSDANKQTISTIYNLCQSMLDGIAQGDIEPGSLSTYGDRLLTLVDSLKADQDEKQQERREFDHSLIKGFERMLHQKAQQSSTFSVSIPILVLFDTKVHLQRFSELDALFLGPYDVYGDSHIVLEDQKILVTPDAHKIIKRRIVSKVNSEQHLWESIGYIPSRVGYINWMLRHDQEEQYRRALAPHGSWPRWGLLWS